MKLFARLLVLLMVVSSLVGCGASRDDSPPTGRVELPINPPPSISAVNPTFGEPGDPVVISGSGLTGATSLLFGSSGPSGSGASAVFFVVNDGQINTTVPLGAASGSIRVFTPGGSAESPASFTVLSSAPPLVTSFNPPGGGAGANVTVFGSSFTGATLVEFGSTPASFWLVSDGEIETWVPAGASTAPITVTNSLGSDSSPSNFVIAPAPLITSFSPPSGSAGIPVVINGSNFNGATVVTFGDDALPGGGASATFAVNNNTKITATVPADALSGPIKVVTPGGVAFSPDSFIVLSSGPPTISGFDPPSGAIGNFTRITGTNFSGTTQVKFNGVPTENFYVEGSTSIAAYIPEGATSGPISVTNTLGTATSGSNFTVIPKPQIFGLNPGSAPPGQPVVITGSGFNGATSVRFGWALGGMSATFTVNNDGQITATVPSGASNGPIAIDAPGGYVQSSSSFTVLASAPPVITSFSPITGGANQSVSIYGSSFTGTTQIAFNGVFAGWFELVSDTELRTNVPWGAATGPITVTNTQGATNSSTNFTIIPPPHITSFAPASGIPGAPVVITGTGFSGATQVRFGNDKDEPAGGGSGALFTVNSNTQITAQVPSGASSGPISVETPYGFTESDIVFTVLASDPPIIDSFSPDSGGANASVTIFGSHFTGTTSVEFNGVSAEFDLLSDAEIRARVPDGATSGLISVTNDLGTDQSSTQFTVIPPPTVTNLSALTGAPGATVIITGTGFAGVTFVGFGGMGESSPEGESGGGGALFTILSNTQISATVPSGAQSGPVFVRSLGGFAQSQQTFTVLSSEMPVITTLNPMSGAEHWSVHIFGNGFTGTTEVKFNGTAASFNLLTDSEIQTSVPEGATTGPVTVKNTLGTATSSSNFVVYLPPTISSFSPDNATATTSVIITGTGFAAANWVGFSASVGGISGGSAANPGGGDPKPTEGPFATVSAIFTVNNDNQITVTVPAGAVTGPIWISTPYGTGSSPTDFVVLSSAAPQITSFSPTTGGVNSEVLVFGSKFTGTTAVEFNGVPAPGFWLEGDGVLRTWVPNGATSGPITVINTFDQVTSGTSFAVIPPPQISGFSPPSGPAGTPVTINGTGFIGVQEVRFGGGSHATFSVVSSTVIQTTVPLGARSGPIEVWSQSGPAWSQASFNVSSTAPPSLTSFSPGSGLPGHHVRITGANFTGANEVTFNGISTGEFWMESDNALEVVVPTGATTGPISVTNTLGSGQSGTNFVVLPLPTIDGFSPPMGMVGDSVIITGSGFANVQSVRFGDANAEFIINSDAQITAKVPYAAESGPIEVAGAFSQGSFTVLSAAEPKITGFSPTSGYPGQFVHIYGQDFTGTTEVLFDMTPSQNFFLEWDGTLVAYIPAGATSGPISVTNTVGTDVSTDDFTVLLPPTIGSFAPPSGPVGQSVVITGTGLLSVEEVAFGGVAATFTASSNTQITATVPVGAVTGRIELDHEIRSATDFVVLSTNLPTISSVSPGSGGVDAKVTIIGTGFSGTTSVEFNGVPAAFGVQGDTVLLALVPLGATTGLITVTNNIGSVTSASNFTVTAPPSITSVNPASGSAGDPIILNGTGLAGTQVVRFGPFDGINAQFTVLGPTQISVVVPDGAMSGPIEISGTSGSASSPPFTVISTDPPVVTSFSPGTGAPGAIVSIGGSGFTGVTGVSFGGVPAAAFKANSDVELDVIVPAGALTGPITVTNSLGSDASSQDFVVVPGSGMTITSVSPSGGAVGTTVTIVGTNLSGAEVMFAHEKNAPVITNTGTTLTVVVPPGAITGSIVLFKGANNQNGPSEIAFWPLFTVHVASCAAAPAGTPCGLCAVCAGGTCSGAAADDGACGVIDCDGLDGICGDRHDLSSGRCEAISDCKDANTADCTAMTATQAGTDCGTCGSCNGTGYCVADLAQDGDCAGCEECAGVGSCSPQPNGSDVKNDCPAATCRTGSCNGSGACGYAVNGSTCDDGSLCTSGETCQSGSCGSPTSTVVCSALDSCHDAGVCSPSTGTCSNPAKADGSSCADAIACTLGESCQAGVCVVFSDTCECDDNADCTAQDQCHVAGICDPATHSCTYAPKNDGTACNDANACTSGESCQAGVCGAPTSVVVCAALDQCHDAGVCDQVTGVCSDPAKADGSVCTDGIGCTHGDECQAGVCGWQINGCECLVDADCPAQDQCHDAGSCDPVTHLCSSPSKADGTVCDDADACTYGETCQNGACGSPTFSVMCSPIDQCHDAGSCDPATGVCTEPALQDGSPCTDGVGCTTGDSCQTGACVAAVNDCACTTDADCWPLDQCHDAGSCDPVMHVCSDPAKPDGAPCNDSNACTSGETCQAGACGAPTMQVSCPARNECEEVGTCNPASGACQYAGKPDGTTCSDGQACTTGDSCVGGNCVPTVNNCPCATDEDCIPLDQCHEGGSCDPVTELCTNPLRTDGSLCSDADACTSGEACHAGACNTPSSVVTCTDPQEECIAAPVCDRATAQCAAEPLPDSTSCSLGVCQSGACSPDGGEAGAPSGSGGSSVGTAGSAGTSGGAGGSATTGNGGSGGDTAGAPSGDAGEMGNGGNAAGAPPAGGSKDDSGCGCRIVPASRSGDLAVFAFALALGLARVRRRRAFELSP